MKTVFSFLLCVLFTLPTFAQGHVKNNTSTTVDTSYAPTNALPIIEEYASKAESLPRTTIKFDNETFDFKVIKEGDEVRHRFNFKNTGKKDLIITNVKPSCGCTTPSWSQEPVKPGQKGFIDVKFNSSGKSGQQNKMITVTGNFEGDINKVLKLVGEVKGKTPQN